MKLSSPKIIIRPMRRKDADTVVRMAKRLAKFHKETSPITLDFLLRHTGARQCSHIFVASLKGKLIGFALTKDIANFVRNYIDCHLDLLFVEEAWRGNGLGKMMIEHASTQALHRGCARLLTSSAPTNRKAKYFYQALGFNIRSQKPVRYILEGKALRQLAKQKT